MQGDNKGFQVSRKKMQMSATKLCQGYGGHSLSTPFRKFCDAAMGLRFDEEPKYEALIALFEPLVGNGVARPIAIAPETIKVCAQQRASPCPELWNGLRAPHRRHRGAPSACLRLCAVTPWRHNLCILSRSPPRSRPPVLAPLFTRQSTLTEGCVTGGRRWA